MISVFLVEDSPIALNILERLLKTSSDLKIVGTARNGMEALEKIPTLKPDVICTDLMMGKMDGLELIKHIMADSPRPVLVISQALKENGDKTLELLNAGAVDVFPKPGGLDSDYQAVREALIHKIKVVSGVKVFTKTRRRSGLPVQTPTPAPLEIPSSDTFSSPLSRRIQPGDRAGILAIGASTGGPQAVRRVLAKLPSDFPLPIMITQHISLGFLAGLVDWQNSICRLKIKVASIGEMPVPGTVYYAPERHHLEINHQGKLIYANSPPVENQCPSVTTMFRSVAQHYGANAIAVLLTGMGRDGAEGMAAIAQRGGITIAQDEASSTIFGMPKEAIALGVVKYVLDVEEIAGFILGACLK
jgi:two-component system chemotaxis response regulator CheB